ncbi:MAG: YkgJ family cysteine cluster protein [Polyangiales bacterium]
MTSRRSTPEPRVRPLLVRPGAGFRCEGDGLCCTDLHALGPMTRSETVAMRRLIPGSVHYHTDVEAPCMRPGPDGRCAQLRDGRCGVHARYGAEHKPVGCRRFPYGLLSTPLGGRVTTEHRCPCRTLGKRPPIDLAEAEASLRDQAGRLESDEVAPRSIALSASRRVRFERYAELEAGLLTRLERGERPERVLDAKPFPVLGKRSWPSFAAELLTLDDRTRGGVALAWFADALFAGSSGHRPPRRERPWRDAFERGARRPGPRRTGEQVLADWLGDELWMMRWLPWRCSFDVARAELATRLAAARTLSARLRRQGVREDQAAAEGVMAAELCASCELWGEAVRAIAADPSPASELELSRPH